MPIFCSILFFLNIFILHFHTTNSNSTINRFAKDLADDKPKSVQKSTLLPPLRPLIIVAHADDELLFGLPIFLTAGMYRPHVVILTKTDTNRQLQLEQAANKFNYTHESLNYPDGPDHHQFDVDQPFLQKLLSIISNRKWSGIYTHGPTGEYGHPQHIQCSNVVSRLVLNLSPTPSQPTLYYFSPMYDESTISRSYLAVKKTYSMESITWSTHWHAKIIRWDHYNLLNQRKLCKYKGYQLWHENCEILDLTLLLKKYLTLKRDSTFKKIGIVHYRPLATPLKSFEVGFRSALNILCNVYNYNITYLNINDLEGTTPESNIYNRTISKYNNMDILLIKSNWNWIPDTFIRSDLHVNKNRKQSKVLLISGVAPLPKLKKDILYYDALVYETKWYEEWQQLKLKHPNVHQAFGIDTNIMQQEQSSLTSKKEWDMMFIGWMAPWKRLHLFVKHFKKMKLKNNKLRIPTAIAIGKLDATPESSNIIQMLQDAGIVVRSEVSYYELAKLIKKSKLIYIPSTLQGGGERAVLEALACGIPIKVENDNDKLLELSQLKKVPGHLEYANGLHLMLQSLRRNQI